jgi:hypothetical protein
MKITGSEKAFLGGLVSGLFALIIQLQQSGQFTTKIALFSIGSFVAAHIAVYLTTNTPKPPVVPSAV